MTRKNTNRAQYTAQAIRQELTEQGIEPRRVQSETQDLTTTVQVTLVDANPATLARARQICAKYQIIHEDDIAPGRLIDNRRDDIPQVGQVEVKNNLTDDLCVVIARFIKRRTENNPTIQEIWEMFEGKRMDFWLSRPASGRAMAA